MKSISWRYGASIWGAALLLACFTYLQPGTHLDLEGEMDHSWAWGINYAFHKGWVMGRDIYFTFGPLGFLEHTRMVSENIFYLSSLFSWIISLAMNALLLHFAWQAGDNNKMRFVNLVVVVALIVFSFPHLQRLLIVGYAAMFLHWLTGNARYLLLQCAVVVLCLLVKFSYGAAALSLFLSYLALWWYRHRETKTILATLLGMGLLYLLFWMLIYGDLSGAWGYLEGEFHISRGNASAMAINPENNWLAIMLFYGALLVAGMLLHSVVERRYALLPLIFVGPLFVWTKYTFSQEQALHFIPILDFAVFVLPLFLVAQTIYWRKAVLVLLLCGAIFSWEAMHTESVGAPDYANIPQVTINKPEIVKHSFSPRTVYWMWKRVERERLSPLLLPEKIKTSVGNASVDVYPWSLVVAAVNKLNWHPRPAFQIYISYLPFLDKKNSDFFADSQRSPRFILWHHHQPQDIMNRYALSSEPLTLASILNHYRMLYCEGIFCLWERTEQEQMTSSAGLEQTVKWNEWITVPEVSGQALRARLAAHRNLWGNLNLMLWKEGGIDIDYQLPDGSIKTHALLIDNAVSGVWVSPYVPDSLGKFLEISKPLEPQKLQHILAQTPAQGQLERVEQTPTGPRVVGWATPSTENRSQEHFLLIFNRDNAFLLPAQKFNRSDVVEYFRSTGRDVAGQCGFYEEITAGKIPPGDYRVRLVVKAGGQWAPLPDQGATLHMGESRKLNQVTAIRFRNARPWAFDDDMSLQWQIFDFKEKSSWK